MGAVAPCGDAHATDPGDSRHADCIAHMQTDFGIQKGYAIRHVWLCRNISNAQAETACPEAPQPLTRRTRRSRPTDGEENQ